MPGDLAPGENLFVEDWFDRCYYPLGEIRVLVSKTRNGVKVAFGVKVPGLLPVQDV